jgi:hypothetical protein
MSYYSQLIQFAVTAALAVCTFSSTAAERAGLKAGDIVIAIGSSPATDAETFVQLTRRRKSTSFASRGIRRGLTSPH